MSTFRMNRGALARGIYDYDRYLPIINELRRSEIIARLMTPGVLGLAKGQIPNFLVRRKGARVVEIVETVDGLVLKNGFAKVKRAHLENDAAVAMQPQTT